jgi:hypothetical protein
VVVVPGSSVKDAEEPRHRRPAVSAYDRASGREGVAGPFGGAWSPSTIYGNGKRGTGILNNEFYVGRLVWNRLRYVKNPDTGKRVSRLNPEAEWMRKEVQNLRIVPDDLWTAAKSRQQQTRHTVKTAGALGAAKRPQYLFSGLTKCGVCGAGFIMSGKNHGCPVIGTTSPRKLLKGRGIGANSRPDDIFWRRRFSDINATHEPLRQNGRCPRAAPSLLS